MAQNNEYGSIVITEGNEVTYDGVTNTNNVYENDNKVLGNEVQVEYLQQNNSDQNYLSRLIFTEAISSDPFKKTDPRSVNTVYIIKNHIKFKEHYKKVLDVYSKTIIQFHADNLAYLGAEVTDLSDGSGTRTSVVAGASFLSAVLRNNEEKHIENTTEHDDISYIKINVVYSKDLFDFQLLVVHCHEMCHVFSLSDLIVKYYKNGNLELLKNKYSEYTHIPEALQNEHIEIGEFKGKFRELCKQVIALLYDDPYREHMLTINDPKYMEPFLLRDGGQRFAPYTNYYNRFLYSIIRMAYRYYALRVPDQHPPINGLWFWGDYFESREDFRNGRNPVPDKHAFEYKLD